MLLKEKHHSVGRIGYALASTNLEQNGEKTFMHELSGTFHFLVLITHQSAGDIP